LLPSGCETRSFGLWQKDDQTWLYAPIDIAEKKYLKLTYSRNPGESKVITDQRQTRPAIGCTEIADAIGHAATVCARERGGKGCGCKCAGEDLGLIVLRLDDFTKGGNPR
jgi:hypothetical protein